MVFSFYNSSSKWFKKAEHKVIKRIFDTIVLRWFLLYYYIKLQLYCQEILLSVHPLSGGSKTSCLFPLSAAAFQNLRKIMANEYKLYSQKHIACNIPCCKSIDSVDRNHYGYNSQRPCAASGFLRECFSRHCQHHAPMVSQMKGHPHKSPVGRKHVQTSGKGAPAVNRQEGKGMSGKNNAADHGADHTKQYQNHQKCLPDSQWCITSFQKIFRPFTV